MEFILTNPFIAAYLGLGLCVVLTAIVIMLLNRRFHITVQRVHKERSEAAKSAMTMLSSTDDRGFKLENHIGKEPRILEISSSVDSITSSIVTGSSIVYGIILIILAIGHYKTINNSSKSAELYNQVLELQEDVERINSDLQRKDKELEVYKQTIEVLKK